jgi:putative membrane protein
MNDHSPPSEALLGGSDTVELASDRTGLAFERTRMAADRTLMATVRTALSLIGFGFTINEVFQQFGESGPLRGGPAAHYFGLALVLLGICSLVLGLLGHRRFMIELARRKQRLFKLGLDRHGARYERTSTFITAIALLLLGLAAAISIIWRSFLT